MAATRVDDLTRVSERHPGGLSVWVVYENPKDLPFVPFVVREQVVHADTLWINPQSYGFHDLLEARAWLEQLGLTCIPRDPDDDPVIVESWV